MSAKLREAQKETCCDFSGTLRHYVLRRFLHIFVLESVELRFVDFVLFSKIWRHNRVLKLWPGSPGMVQRAHSGRCQTLQNTMVFTPGSLLELHFTRFALIWHIFGSAGGAKNVVKYSVWRPREAFVEALGISQTLRFSMFFDDFAVWGVSDNFRRDIILVITKC